MLWFLADSLLGNLLEGATGSEELGLSLCNQRGHSGVVLFLLWKLIYVRL